MPICYPSAVMQGVSERTENSYAETTSEGIVQYFIALKWKATVKIKVHKKNIDKYNTITTPTCS